MADYLDGGQVRGGASLRKPEYLIDGLTRNNDLDQMRRIPQKASIEGLSFRLILVMDDKVSGGSPSGAVEIANIIAQCRCRNAYR